jgi:hypothetical protein
MSGPVLLVLRIILAISLYAFLGLALLTLWLDLRRQGQSLAAHRPPSINLHSQDGELAYHFDRTVVSIGRDLACDCSFQDQTVSAQHARLSYHHNQWWIEDLGSTNGTFLNHEPVASPLVITQGDELRIGQVVLRISLGD